MTWVLAAVAGPLLALAAHDLLRRPTIRRLALRNVGRRRGEAVLVVVGSLLGTAIITGSFLVGDTLRSSIRDAARTELGPVDEVVRVSGLEQFPGVAGDLAASRPPGIDGVLGALSAPASAVTLGPDRRAEPDATLLEVDFDAGRGFGSRPADTGLVGAGATPADDEVVIATDLADRLGVGPGDPFELHAYDTRRLVTVRQVVPKVGLAGYGRPTIFVPPGTIAAAAPALEAAGSRPPAGLVLISNAGGVFEGADQTALATAQLRSIVGSPAGVEIEQVKADLLERAEADAADFVDLFGGIGAFSVVAGVLLLVNVFVMLAEERRSELGMLRAVGLKRNGLVRAFGAEGALYATAAALAGGAIGVGVGRAVVVVAEGVLNSGVEERFRLVLRFSARPASIVGGMVIGGAIALLTSWATSVRIGQLNVIRAIRELPGPDPRRSRRPVVAGTVAVVAGGALTVAGIGQGAWVPLLAGPPVVALGAVPLLAGRADRRGVVTVACAAVIAWSVAASSLVPGAFEGSGIAVFVVEGVILVTAAVVLAAANAEAAGRLLTSVAATFRRGLAPRLALAYPTARRFRTAMLLGTYALIVFVLVFLAVLNNLFQAEAPQFLAESRGGFDLVIDSNASSPATVNDLLPQPEIGAVAPIVRGFPRFTTPTSDEPRAGAMSGFDRNFFQGGVPELSSRDVRFPDDEAAFQAVLDDPTLVILSDSFLQDPAGAPRDLLHVGDRVTAINPRTTDDRQLTVVGILASDFLDHGALVGAPLARELLAVDAVSNRHLVALAPGVTNPEAVAAALDGRLVDVGVDATSLATLIDRALAQQEGFIRLMQGYLVLGLVVGVAGLGVVMVRAVRERRRQIGMLRALGCSRRLVRLAFLLEAGFIAVQGVVIGAVLAVVVAFQLLSNSDVFGESRLDFSVPWLPVGLLLAAAVAASLATSALPAAQASRIRPAVALRVAD